MGAGLAPPAMADVMTQWAGQGPPMISWGVTPGGGKLRPISCPGKQHPLPGNGRGEGCGWA
jgi:hypothetical protein